MSKLVSLVRRVPVRVALLVASIAAAILVPASLLAWGPTRDTFTIAHPADHVTFNSITDNPVIGDERNFVSIREATSTGTWDDSVTVQPGKQYVVRMYVHNNAASNLNLKAKDVTAKFSLPTNTAKSIDVFGFINSSNAQPKEVYDQATFKSSENFNLAYVPNTLKLSNNYFGSAGVALPESIFTASGAKLGYSSLNGEIPGCFQYAGYVYFTVKPQFAPTSKFTMTKEVSQHGKNEWKENYTAQPGETVDYLLQYKNTGSAQHNDVTFRDTLPAGETYVNNSTVYGNTAHPNGTAASNNLTNGTGINVGDYAPNANAWVIFSAKIADEAALKCGTNTLVNKATVTTMGGSLSDTATVTVNKTCAPEKITVCELATKKIVTIDEDKFDASKYSKDLTKCAETNIQVCELATKKIVTIKSSDFDSSKYSTDLDKCKDTPTPPELPHTGPTETILGLLGIGSIVASLGYYIASRRALGSNQ